MIKEYRISGDTFPDLNHPEDWSLLVAIDLRHVAVAMKHDNRLMDHRFTMVTMQGNPVSFVLDVEYNQFVRDWRSA